MKESNGIKVFEVADAQAHFIEFEFRDGSSDSFPYINLRQIHFEARAKSDVIILYFDQGLVEITGENLTKIKTFIKLNILDQLRVGISTDPNDPAIKNIIYKANKKFDGRGS